jgi:hypothetical protein
LPFPVRIFSSPPQNLRRSAIHIAEKAAKTAFVLHMPSFV